MPENIISAADIEKYGYCPLSWWRSLDKKTDQVTKSEKTGMIKHERILHDIDELREKERESKSSEKLVMWFAVMATVIATTGLSLVELQFSIKFQQIMGVIALIWILAACFFLYKSTVTSDGQSLKYMQIVIIFAIIAMIFAVNVVVVQFLDVKSSEILIVLALLWLVASTIFLYRNIRLAKIASRLRKKHKVSGEIVYTDYGTKKLTKPELFISEKYGISGRPDYVIDVEGEIIPVDIKTGRTPRGPLFSHIMQVGAYCILIEDKYGRPPPYGILKYGDNYHEIDFNDELKVLVLEKVSKMRNTLKTGDVHRNHNRVGKCRTCSQRKGCPERLA